MRPKHKCRFIPLSGTIEFLHGCKVVSSTSSSLGGVCVKCDKFVVHGKVLRLMKKAAKLLNRKKEGCYNG